MLALAFGLAFPSLGKACESARYPGSRNDEKRPGACKREASRVQKYLLYIGAIDNVHLSITDSTITGNYGEGVFAGSGATVVVANNVVTKNALNGFLNISSTFKSRGNNTVVDNFGGVSSGPITPIGGL